MAGKLKVAVYGACHADALETVLLGHPDLAAQIEFVPLEPVMTIADDEMSAFEALAPTLDAFLYQPISGASRGERFASATLLDRLRPGALAVSFPYVHFELYTPFVTAPHATLPPSPTEYVDYLLGALVVRGEDDATIVDRLMHWEGCDEHAILMRGASMYELQAREERVLPGDRPLDIRVLERVRAAHHGERLMHTNNHPGATVMGWIGDEAADQLRGAFNLPAPAAEDAANPDPLAHIDYPAMPFVQRIFGLTFDDPPVARLEAGEVDLARYVALQRPYWEQVRPASLQPIFEETLPPRRWYRPLLEML